ncbi:hypothetical protein [Actinomadura latina]|uniref:Uncharacterized protein n=1 Tax=Actinomadura latina TaxID=163603 RepID=A0A846Z2N2_9ACTN|nr:hypothetical protein [Actinomadura latina]NKZ04985.1 hypothetical protein [Actinomadura latina]
MRVIAALARSVVSLAATTKPKPWAIASVAAAALPTAVPQGRPVSMACGHQRLDVGG